MTDREELLRVATETYCSGRAIDTDHACVLASALVHAVNAKCAEQTPDTSARIDRHLIGLVQAVQWLRVSCQQDGSLGKTSRVSARRAVIECFDALPNHIRDACGIGGSRTAPQPIRVKSEPVAWKSPEGLLRYVDVGWTPLDGWTPLYEPEVG